MCRAQCVLALLALSLDLGLAQSFSWDIVLAKEKGLEFLNNGVPTYSATPSTTRLISWITYDPKHNRVLFSNRFNSNILVYSFDIATRKTESFSKKCPDGYLRNLAYDPNTELLFATKKNSIYSFSLKTGGDNEVNGDVVINLEMDNIWFRDVAVDGFGSYIYWISDTYTIERARINGAEREVLVDSNIVIRKCLTVDTQKMYWIEYQEDNDYEFFVQRADLEGENKITFYKESQWEYPMPEILTISKDYIYWGHSNENFFWQLPKNSQETNVKAKKISIPWNIQDIAVNYNTIENQTQNCKAIDDSTAESLLCLHGTKVSGQSPCECTQGYTGDRCEVSVCHNYCVQGDCSVSAEGQPKCRCNGGYSGDRCEASPCYKHCLNNGVCSLNQTSEPVCQCTGDYRGDRCEVPVFLVKCVQTVTLLNDILNADVTGIAEDKGLNTTCT